MCVPVSEHEHMQHEQESPELLRGCCVGWHQVSMLVATVSASPTSLVAVVTFSLLQANGIFVRFLYPLPAQFVSAAFAHKTILLGCSVVLFALSEEITGWAKFQQVRF